MNIVHKLTVRHLKENKIRSVITTLGIIISVAMITAVFVSIASFMNFFGEVSILTCGDIHAKYYVNEAQLSEIYNDSRFGTVGVMYEGNNNGFMIDSSETVSKRTGTILAGDETLISQIVTGEYTGTLPKNDKEIAVEQELLDKNKLSIKPGDKITLTTGVRYVEDNGSEAFVAGSYNSREKFREIGTDTYTVTAVLHSNPATRSIPIIKGISYDEMYSNEISANVKLKTVDYKSIKELKSVAKEYEIKEYDLNTEYLESKFAFEEGGVLATAILPLTAILLVLIIIASVMLIYNAFGMSLSERVRYLGMLASVGATKRQKRSSVYYEGFILGIIGIPVGIGAGIGGIGITLKVLGDKIISTGMINGVSENNMDMKTVVPLWVIGAIIVFSILTIFISSFIPAVKASAITPIAAIRQTNTIKVKARKLRSPKIIKHIFGYEGELAHKSMKRNGKKSVMITTSIALSVVLFLGVNYFCQMFTQANQYESEIPYQLTVAIDYDNKEKMENKISSAYGVKDYFCVDNSFFRYDKELIDLNKVTKEMVESENLTTPYKNLFDSGMAVYVQFIDDDDFNALCKANDIDVSAFYGDEPNVVLMNNVGHKEGGAKVFTDKIIGKALGDDTESYHIKGLVDYDKNNYVCNLTSKNTIVSFMPESTKHKIFDKDNSDDISMTLIGVVTESHEETCSDIESIIEEDGFTEGYVNDMIEQMQMINTVIYVLEVFVYGFIALITLVTVANIVNTVSTGIQLRKKEFAMLKSVGTTPRGFRRMIALESIFYGIKALIFAVPISIGLSYLMNKQIASGAIPFEINYVLYLAVIFTVFAIIGISMLISTMRLSNNSIVETLKEEIN